MRSMWLGRACATAGGAAFVVGLFLSLTDLATVGVDLVLPGAGILVLGGFSATWR